MNLVWFEWTVFLLIIWLIVYLLLKDKESKREMLTISFWTSFLGLTEPLFVPIYWNPPSLFNLAQNTGFDIESILFSFAVGGIAAVILELFIKVKHKELNDKDIKYISSKNYTVLFLGVLLFIVLYLFTSMNPIYDVVISLLVLGFMMLLLRQDLKTKMLFSSVIFTVLYFFFFLTLLIFYPDYITHVWNFSNISGILVYRVPMEELLFALSVGLVWGGLYEFINNKYLVLKNKGRTIN